jgi:hypothetical protein
MEVKEIKELYSYLTQTYHSKRRAQQEKDESFINDAIDISYLPEGVTPMKTGKAYRMVSAPAEHIITSNPQVFRNTGENRVQEDKRVAQELNRWARVLLRQTPQPFKEFVKKLLGRGESWIYTIHNDNYDKSNPLELPIKLLIPDPLIVYTDGNETNGVPERVIISYQRVADTILRDYPKWKWTKKGNKTEKDKVPYFMYMDSDVRYIDADGDPLLVDNNGEPYNGNGIQENIYGFVPFVHTYAGFGYSSPDGDPATLCISRITNIRDLVREYTAIRSVINYLIFQYAQPPLDFEYDPQVYTPPDDFAEKYSRKPKSFNIVPVTHTGGGMKKGVDMLPDQQLFLHLYNIENQIDEEDPLGTLGQIIGTSGRQQIDAKSSSLRRYDTIVENTAHSFETAFGQGLKLCENIPSIYPKGLNQDDIKKNYTLSIELKSEDYIETNLRRTDGDRKQAGGIIDWETNLTQYQGYTQEESQKIMDKSIVDSVILNDPIIRRLIAIQTAKEMGMEQQYTELEKALGAPEQGVSTVPKYGSKGGEPRTGNIKTPTGAEQIDMSMAQRPIRAGVSNV